MSLLKMLSDISIMMSGTGFLAVKLGASPMALILGTLALSLLFALSSLIRAKGKLRYLPFLLLPALFLLPELKPAGMVLTGIAALYGLWQASRLHYDPLWSEQVEIFNRYWKIAIPAFLFFCMMDYQVTLSVTFPFLLMALMSCILLNRSLRHSREIYGNPRFQLINIALLGAVLLAAFLLGSPQVLSALGKGLGWLYHTLLQPVLMGFVSLVLLLLEWLKKLLGFIRFQPPGPEPTTAAGETGEGSGGEYEPLTQGNFDGRIVVALLIIVFFIVMFFLLRKLARGLGKSKQERIEALHRETLAPPPREKLPKGPVRVIRDYYRRYLKLYRSKDIPLSPADTSLEVLRKGQESFDPQTMHSLRELYLKARYKEEAGEEEADLAKKLYQELKNT